MHIDSLSLFHVAFPARRPRSSPAGPAIPWKPSSSSSPAAARWAGARRRRAMPRPAIANGRPALRRAPRLARPGVVKTEIDSGKTLAERLAPFRGNQYAKAALISPGGTSGHECRSGRCMSCWARKCPHPRPLSPQAGEASEVEVGPCLDQMQSPEPSWRRSPPPSRPAFGGSNSKSGRAGPWRCSAACGRSFPAKCSTSTAKGRLSLNYMEMLYRFDDFALEMVEQPLAGEDLVAHAMLQESLRTPICLDESIASPLHAEMALDLKSCRHVNLKAGRVGGLTRRWRSSRPARPPRCVAGAAPRRKARSALGPIWPWPPARLPIIRPISFPPKANWPRTWPSRCIRSAMRARRVKIALAAEPGLGVVPDPALLRNLRLQKAEM